MGFIIAFLGTGMGIGLILMLLAYGLDAFFGDSAGKEPSQSQVSQTRESLPPPRSEDRLRG